MDESPTHGERGREALYLPDEGLVRATVEAACCLTEPTPRSAGELLHLATCRECQSYVESAALSERWSATLFVPSDALVATVVARSAIPRFRFPWDDRRAASARERRPTRAAAGFLIALGLSPSVLAAAVLVHAAALIAGGAWLARTIEAPNSSPLAERVEYVALAPLHELSASAARPVTGGNGVTSELESVFRQSIRVVAGRQPRFSADDAQHLSRTAVTLRQLVRTNVRVEADSTPDALRLAEEVSRYLTRRGVDSKRVRIVVHPGLVNVEVALDQDVDPSRAAKP